MDFLFTCSDNVLDAYGWRTVSVDFHEFTEHVLTAGINIEPNKGKTNLPAVCVAPLSDSPAEGLSRAGADARPTAVLMLDADDATAEQYARVKAAISALPGFMYTTATHNKPKKGKACPRFRVMLHLDRAVTHEERQRLIVYFMALFGLPVDASNLNATQPMFIACKGAEITHGDPAASPINVGEALEKAPAIDAVRAASGTRKSKGTKTNETKTAEHAAPDGTSAPGRTLAGLDPVLERLLALGLTDGVARPDGGMVCTCPFEDEHTTEGGRTSTVFYPAGTDANRDKNGEPFRLGHFSCLHGHCANRPLSDYCERLGIDYQEYVRYCNGDTPTAFKSTESGTRFRVDAAGTYAQRMGKDGSPLPERRIAGTVRATGTLSNVNGSGWALLVEWRDRGGAYRRGQFEYANTVKQNATDALKVLADGGLLINGRSSAALLLDYLSSVPTLRLPHTTAVDRCGWFKPKDAEGRVFVLSAGTIGQNGEPTTAYVFSGGSAANLGTRGALDDWKKAVASRAADSSRIGLAICAAFAAPCLDLLDAEGGCFNLYGASSKGKSLALRSGASVYGKPSNGEGGYIHSWDNTATAIELLMAGHNDLLLCLDEGGRNNGRDIGRTIYALANGIGRGRGTVENNQIGLRASHHWRLLGLASSEKTTAELLQAAGQAVNAGQEVRLADVPAVAVRDDLGIFERVRVDGKTDAEAIEKATTEQYGTAGAAWLRYLTAHTTKAREQLKLHAEAFRKTIAEGMHLGTQAGRVLDRFAWCAAAGEVASAQGLTDWPAGFASEKVAACARACLPRFSQDREKVHAIKRLLEATTTGIGRFVDADANTHAPTSDIYGYSYACDEEGRRVCPFETFSAAENDRIETAPATRLTACLILKPAFEKLCAPLPKETAAVWLESAGVLKVIGARKGAGHGVSRIREIRGRGTQCSGYLVLPHKIEQLAESLGA